MPTPIAEASLTQQRALAVIPKVSSALSLFGSCYIIFDTVRMAREPASGRRGRVNGSDKMSTYHRILLGTSVSDILASGAWFFTTWPIDREVFPAYAAIGNRQTCTAQGFFAQFSISTVLYSGSLSFYYLLVIRQGWSESQIVKSRVAFFMHTLALTMGIGTSTYSATTGLLNPIGWDCWISAVPLGCQESWLNHGETTCIRGDNANLYQWCFFYGPLWVVILFVSIAMFLVCTSFRKTERRSMKWQKRLVSTYNTSASERTSCTPKEPVATNNYGRSRMVIGQAIWYAGSFYIVWFFPTILRIHEVTSDTVYYHWVLLSAMFVPLQGFFNVLIYLRPKFIKKRQQSSRNKQIRHFNATFTRQDQSVDVQFSKKSCSQVSEMTMVGPGSQANLENDTCDKGEATAVGNLGNINSGQESLPSSLPLSQEATEPPESVEPTIRRNPILAGDMSSSSIRTSVRNSTYSNGRLSMRDSMRSSAVSIRNFAIELKEILQEGDGGEGNATAEYALEDPQLLHEKMDVVEEKEEEEKDKCLPFVSPR